MWRVCLISAIITTSAMKKNSLLILVSALAIAALVGGYYFYSSATAEENLGLPIAEVESIKNQLRFKHSSGFFWSDAAKKQKLFDRSQVFTGDSSEALILVKNKDQIQLPAETLLLISEEKKQPGVLSLNLQQGSMHFQGKDGGRISVTMGNKTLMLSSQVSHGFFMKRDLKGDLTVSVSNGSLNIENGQQKKILNLGQAVELSKVQNATQPLESQIVVNDLTTEPIILINPPPDKNIFGIPYEFFRWKVPEADRVFLEYGSSENLLVKSNKEEVTSLNESLIPQDLKEGKYFWRIVIIKNNTPRFSETRNFRVEKHVKSKPGNFKLSFKERGKWKLSIPVEGGTPGDKYNFQIGLDNMFTELFDEYQGPEPLTSFIDRPGKYFVRLRRYFGEGGYSDWSAVPEVVVRPPLDPPQVNSMEEKLLPTGKVEIPLQWSGVQNASDYLVQISDSPAFKNILKNVIVEKSPFTFKHDQENAGYLRVLARSTEGEYSPPSKVYPIKGILKGPKIIAKEFLPPPVDEPNVKSQVRILWEHRGAATGYKVEIGQEPNLVNSKAVLTENIEFRQNVEKTGNYYFRVWPVALTDKYFVLPTMIFAVNAQLPGTMGVPKLLSPKKNEVFLVPQGLSISIKFGWTAIPDKEYYVLQLAQEKTFSRPSEFNVTGEQYVLNKSLSGGRWFFRVRAKNKYQVSAWSEIGECYVGVSQ
jgi:hypothetical protein